MTLDKAQIVDLLEMISGMEEDDLNHVSVVLQSRKTLLKRLRSLSFGKGAKVKIRDKEGNIVKGVISRHNRTSVVVDVDGHPVRVDPDAILQD